MFSVPVFVKGVSFICLSNRRIQVIQNTMGYWKRNGRPLSDYKERCGLTPAVCIHSVMNVCLFR